MKKASIKKIILCLLGFLILMFVVGNLWPYEMPSNIIHDPAEQLHVVSERVENFDDDLQSLVNELEDTMAKIDNPFKVFGLGIAAPQIGVNHQVALVKKGYKDYQLLVNPVILESKWYGPWMENCFSVNGAHFLNRAFWIKVSYQDIDGELHEEVFVGPKAAIAQQEIDHLNGILINE